MNDNEQEHYEINPWPLSIAISIVMWAAIIAIVRMIFFGG
jgi:hypothetical protein